MATPQDHISMALFCDFENVALGVRDANYEKFDIKRVLERLLLKGSIVVKKSYCDWERYKGFKATMHEANFELIEIPHVRQSGKNSADIRMVVDALDLCYTKAHVNTFVIISGDSDFSPLVSKLRENAKYVIGVGVKQSTSDLLIANCDEFIFYDDLVRESQRQDARRNNQQGNQNAVKRSPEEEKRRRDEVEARRIKAVEMAAETYEALVTDRDEGGRIWASVLKEAIKRRNPGFNENYYGFRTFGNLLEFARLRGLLEFGRDEKSGSFVYRSMGGVTPVDTNLIDAGDTSERALTEERSPRPPRDESRDRSRGRGRDRDRDRGERQAEYTPEPLESTPQTAAVEPEAPSEARSEGRSAGESRRRNRGGRRSSGKGESTTPEPTTAPVAAEPKPVTSESWYEPLDSDEVDMSTSTPATEPDTTPAVSDPNQSEAAAKPSRSRRPRQAAAKTAGKTAAKTATDAGAKTAAAPKPARKRAPKAEQA
ncbi:MAG TPA: NYN domain-containing protein [Aquabacterium sp.]|uniref:NYN domain-containing protein n=1 Tax=Aquabacterium sp. TaxID=1872578 RepID=UPI002E36271A|nr:NYN domain-containing protein [Aquabacterium sp.]HEX5374109.1 NYN domain-containing protein [Aquabacterium sp.]